ncbi:hypothetical protein B0H14DRAFT_2701316 [Mycena olivaceomarginata]|nr:hypothetical protein B0H14DRAFT_2701316 [Mycena olivaceomarginata]
MSVGMSASVTRILHLAGFPKELKTKHIQAAFSEWQGDFKIKWRDDTSLLMVFQDASVAKQAYLHTIAFPPATYPACFGGRFGNGGPVICLRSTSRMYVLIGPYSSASCLSLLRRMPDSLPP